MLGFLAALLALFVQVVTLIFGLLVMFAMAVVQVAATVARWTYAVVTAAVVFIIGDDDEDDGSDP